MRQVQNRRFMYQPQTGTLILGYQYKGGGVVSSHADEHDKSGATEPYDSFIRGWIGTGRQYPNGVIHFAPAIPPDNAAAFDKAFSVLQMFSENGANANTVVRGFGSVWEQPISNFISPNEERSDKKSMSYSSYDHDKLEAASNMRIERTIYFESEKADIAPYASLPLAQLLSMRRESAEAEQAVFDSLKEQAAAWEEQAGKTLLLDKAIEYARTPHVQHTANEWQTTEHNSHTRSNRVYQMSYYIYENTRYDREKQQSIPYSWTLTWSVRTNSPSRYGQAKIAGQDRKTFADKAAMEKYLNGRIKAYDRLFTEISPAIPKEYADYFKVNGLLMPDYTIEGEEPPQPQRAAAIPENTGQQKEDRQMDGQFSIMIGNRSRFEVGDPSGVWLDMPATKEQLHEAMRSVGITADNPQDFSIRGYSDDPEKHIALPYEMVCAADVDELNFLAARLHQLDPAEVGKLNAALQRENGFENIGQVIDFTYNVDYFVHIPEVHTTRDLGDYYLNQSGMVQMPEEWKGGIDLAAFGKNAAAQEKGTFTEYGYLVESGDEWERQFEGREVPEEYRVMSYPQPERGEQDKAFMDAAETPQDGAVADEQQPRPVVPIILTSEKPAEKIKEITARLEQGVQAIFDSDRYKEFLTAMSKFHDYSLNNTILIAMQGGNLVKGYTQWQKDFDRHVKSGEKGIKIFAPAPYKVKKLVDKIDPETRKPMLDREGKAIKEEKEITVPAFKVVTVFDISQTEGKEFPDLSVKPLLADVEQYEDFFAAIEKASPVPIAFEQIGSGANGYFSLTDKRIAIKEGVSELQAVKTAIHEIAHAKLHDVDLNAPPEQQNRVDRHTREVQAESVAYTVCQHFGLDTSDYSFGYVAGWSSGKEMTELKASLETIQATAKELITEIEGHFTQLQQQREAEQEQQAPVFDKLPPEQQQALSDTVKDTLQMLVEADKRIYGDVTGKTLEAITAQGYSYKDGQLEKQQPEMTPDGLMTGETVQTPRGNFYITDMSREQIEAAGYGFHHASEDGKYLIMGNGTRAFAIAAEQPERDNPLKAAEQTVEQNENMIDGIINNTPQTPTVADLEQRAKAGEAISVTDLAKAVQAEKGKQPPQKKTSILKKLDEYKKQAAQQPKKQQQKEKNKDLEV